MATILCVDDEATTILILEDALQRAGHKTIGVHNVQAAMNVLARGGVDLIISDYSMPGATGLEFLDFLDREGIEVPLIMVTGNASIEHAVATMKRGAIDYITKPIRPQQLELAVDQALELVRLKKENAQLREEVTQFRTAREIIGESEALKRIMQTVQAVARTNATVLLQGESGTGKELLSRAVHNLSDRADGPFVAINCAAIPKELVESTLFGHEKGAFTGADRRRIGEFERADGGTLLLDEISEMELGPQAKLLRVLEEREVRRVGGDQDIKVNVRIVATTNRNLLEYVEAGQFRQDLYYRLNDIPIQVPSLRERREDIPHLVQHFVQRTSAEVGKLVTSVSPDAMELLQNQSWPGNIRELYSKVRRAVILCPSETLTASAFDPGQHGLSDHTEGVTVSTHAGGANGGPGKVVLNTLNLQEAERVLIDKALEETGGNRTKAAEILGIAVRTLRNKLNNPSD